MKFTGAWLQMTWSDLAKIYRDLFIIDVNIYCSPRNGRQAIPYWKSLRLQTLTWLKICMTFKHCIGLGHETMVYAVCFDIFLLFFSFRRNIYSFALYFSRRHPNCHILVRKEQKNISIYAVNVMADDDLTTTGAKTPPTVILTYFLWINLAVTWSIDTIMQALILCNNAVID